MDGELQLKCNVLACRMPIGTAKRAVVTTCSHLFCEECATRAFSTALVCPACDSPLTDQDDIAFTDLCPTENHKSAVLSGLPPSVIHDIAGRALSFWVYQVTQELCYSDLVQRRLDGSLKESENKYKGMVMQANQEMAALREKLSGAEQEKERERRKLHELTEQYAEKSRQLQKMQQLYDRLKRKTLMQQAGGARAHYPSAPDVSNLSLSNSLATTPAPQPTPSLLFGNIQQHQGNTGSRIPLTRQPLQPVFHQQQAPQATYTQRTLSPKQHTSYQGQQQQQLHDHYNQQQEQQALFAASAAARSGQCQDGSDMSPTGMFSTSSMTINSAGPHRTDSPALAVSSSKLHFASTRTPFQFKSTTPMIR